MKLKYKQLNFGIINPLKFAVKINSFGKLSFGINYKGKRVLIETNELRKYMMTLEEDELKEMKRIRDETGFSISKLIDLKKRGYKIVKIEEK